MNWQMRHTSRQWHTSQAGQTKWQEKWERFSGGFHGSVAAGWRQAVVLAGGARLLLLKVETVFAQLG
jgi:hypothetical protein